MKRQVFFLKDSHINDWLVEGFSNRDFPVRFIGMTNPTELLSMSRVRRILSLHARYINVSLKGLLRSRKGDILICFLDVMGLYLFLISRLLFKKREIVAVNIMFNEGQDFLTSVKKILFRAMLKNRHVYPTVTSSELPVTYRRIFGMPGKKFFTVNDCYGNLGKTGFSPSDGNYVFSGGINGRDWKTLVTAAGLLPDIRFIMVGPRRDSLGSNIPSNIEYYYNLPYNEFRRLMLASGIIALPLNTEAPAGLIVLFTAGLMHKPVVSTNNITMREYITSGESGYLVGMGDHKTLALRIRELHSDQELRKRIGEKLFRKVVESGSPEEYIDKLISIVKEVDSYNSSI